MGRVLLDSELRGKLSGLREPLEICDAAGDTIGHFLPVDVYKNLLDGALAAELSISREELEKRRGEQCGRPLAQIWKSMGRA
jgi:hypothetical protein